MAFFVDSLSSYHPFTYLAFYLGALIFGMFLRHPLLTAISIFFSFAYYFSVKKKAGASFFAGMLAAFVVLTFINPFFNSFGTHELFKIFGHPYTFEALVYGAVIAGMVVSVIAWFASFNETLGSEKFMYVFGKAFPSAALVITMVIRFIPDFKKRLKRIDDARKCVGLSGDYLTGKEKLLNAMTESGILIASSLEGSVVTSDSMKCRGYSGGKRTSHIIYKFDFRNIVLLALMAALAAVIIFCTANGADSTEFYPEVLCPGFDNIYFSVCFSAYCALLFIPTFLNIREALLWRVLRSKI